MPNPHLSGAQFSTLTKEGTSYGTVTGSGIAGGNTVNISTNNGKKKWQGSTTTQTSDPSTWNASVTNTQWNNDPEEAPETVTVTVSNADGSSNPVDISSNIP